MNIPEITWGEEGITQVLLWTLILLGIVAYHFFTHSGKLKQKIEAKFGPPAESGAWVFFQKSMGVLWFGVVPFVVASLFFPFAGAEMGLKFSFSKLELILTGGSLLLILVVNLLNAGRPANLEHYPQVRVKSWSWGLVIMHLAFWWAYLIAYEYFFRSFMLFPMVKYWGVAPAIAINTALYSIQHIPKGLKETVAAVVLGIIVCYMSIATGSIFYAVIVHIALATSNFLIALRAHPEMKVGKHE